MTQQSTSSGNRRSFLTRFNAGAAALMALATSGIARAQEKTSSVRFEAARHGQDDWMDAIPGKHRLVLDATSEEGLRDALLYAGNFMLANRNEYGLKNEDLAVIVVVRHVATSHGFNNGMWEKYGSVFGGGGAPAGGAAAAQPREAPKTNPSGGSLTQLASQGVQFAVCSMATNRLAGMAARISGTGNAATFAELGGNLVPNARLVPAGVVALSRAQERGYTLISV